MSPLQKQSHYIYLLWAQSGFPKTFGTSLDILTDKAGVLHWTFHVFVGHLKMSIRFLHFEHWSKCNSYVSNRFKWHFTPHFKWLYFSVDLVEPKILAGHFVWRSRSLSSDIFKFRRDMSDVTDGFREAWLKHPLYGLHHWFLFIVHCIVCMKGTL